MAGAWRELEVRKLTSYNDASEHFIVVMRAVALVWLYNSWCHCTYREGSRALLAWVDAFSVHEVWEASRYSIDEDAEYESEDGEDETEADIRERFIDEVVSEARTAYRVVKEALLSAMGDETELFIFLEASRFHDWAGMSPVPDDARFYVDSTLNGDRLEGHLWVTNGLDPIDIVI